MNPWLCVLMPTLDGAAFVADALESVARENDPGIHCIVVDGGSKDATVSVVRSFAARLPMTILERSDSTGWVWSTNLALNSAQAPNCCFLHQDDLWLSGRAAVMKRVLNEAPEVAMVAHAVRYVDRTGRNVGRLSCPWRPWPARLKAAETMPRLLVQNFIAVPGAVFRTDLAKSCGGLDESLWYTADWDFWLKLSSAGPVAYCPTELAAFRLHAGSQTARGSADQSGFEQQLEIVLERHLERVHELPPAVRKAARLSARVNAALAYESHGGAADWESLAAQALRAGPAAWLRYLRDSRITGRIISRIRAGSATPEGENLLAAAFTRHRMLRFLVVGVVNTAFSYAVYALFVFLGAGVRWASLISLVAGILFGFLSQGMIVFPGFGRWAFARFLVVSALLYHFFIALVFVAESVGINNYVGGALAAPVVAAFSYFLQSRFVFPGRKGP